MSIRIFCDRCGEEIAHTVGAGTRIQLVTFVDDSQPFDTIDVCNKCLEVFENSMERVVK